MFDVYYQSMPKTTLKTSSRRAPQACFDTVKHINSLVAPVHLTQAQRNDFEMARGFLRAYTGSLGTFNSYRRDVERLLHWSWNIAGKELEDVKREDIEAFVRFCLKPPAAWIGIKKAPRFKVVDGIRVPNPEWRPFVATVSKSAFKKGQQPDKQQYAPSNGAVKELLAIIGSFFQYLQMEEYTVSNPVALIRQKSKFVQKRQGQTTVRRLSVQQWQTLIDTAEQLAEEDPEAHERTLFMISTLYGIGKGNKERQIAVSDTLLTALKRWRRYQGMTALPSPGDHAPLFPLRRGYGPLTNTTHVRNIVQSCFDRAIEHLAEQGLKEDSEAMMDATVHWLRHTGISDDVKSRPREHVRDDAGHSSSAITDRYVDIELSERHKSAKRKKIGTD